jgi:hypothetical protein
MASHRTNNPIVLFAAWVVSGILSFLGFQRPTWVREALGTESPPTPVKTGEAPALARQALSVGKPEPARRAASKTRSAAKKAKPARTSKKVSSHRAARERTESLRSSL